MVKWFKRVGIAGFLFFLIKGLIWVGIFFYAKSCVDKKETSTVHQQKAAR
jgi:hypothetical protein